MSSTYAPDVFVKLFRQKVLPEALLVARTNTLFPSVEMNMLPMNMFLRAAISRYTEVAFDCAEEFAMVFAEALIFIPCPVIDSPVEFMIVLLSDPMWIPNPLFDCPIEFRRVL